MQTIEQENEKLTRAGYPPLADCEPLHTPGPWFAVVTDTTCGGEPAIWEITDQHGGVIAEDISHNPANASLISAAPELLSALQLAYNAIAWDIPGGSLSDEEEEALLDTLRAAIAKAEGRVE
jgi:hypothetical protein